MAKITRIKYCEYKKLKDCLDKKFDNSSRLARVLLEAFIFEDGNITSDWFVREKLCQKGDFTSLRKKLVQDEWLVFREDSRRYIPGKRIKPYIKTIESNRFTSIAEFRSLETIVSNKADKLALAKVVDDVQDLKSQVAQIQKILSELRLLQAPPPSAAAQKRSAELTEQLSILLLNAEPN